MAEKRTIELEVKENFKQVEKDLNSLDKALDNTANSARDVNKSFEDVYGDLQPLTARMGEAEDRLYELAAAGDYTSNEYKNLLNTVGEYRKVQINTDLAVDAASMTLSQKLGGALGGVASGFELAQGSMALFGVEGENVQSALLKVQSAMALSQGLQGLKEAKTSFIALGDSAKKTAVGQSILTAATTAYTFVTSAATTGLKLFRAALVSTGIGALIVGVGLLIANFDKILALFTPLIQGFKDFGDWIGLTSFKQDEEDKKAVKRADNRIAEINREKAVREKAQKAKETAYNNEDKALGRQIDLMKAQGKDTTALERARLKATINYQANLQNETFAIFNQNKEKNKLILSELRAIAVREKDFTEYNKFLLSTSATQNELAAENAAANEARKDAINQLAIFETEVAKRNLESQSNYNQQSVKSEEKTAETKIDIARRLEDETLRIREEGRQKELDALDIKYKRQKEDAEKELENDKDKVNKLAKLNSQAIESRKADEKIINDKYDKIEKDAAAKALEDKIKLQDEQWYALQKLKNSQQEQDLLDLQIAYDKEFELALNNAELQKALTDKFNKESAVINEKYRKEQSDKEIAAAKAVQEQKQAIQNQGIELALQGVQLIKSVFENQKGVQKAAVIAESAIGIAKMIIANKLANAGALATPQAIASSGAAAAPVIAMNNISTGIGIAANIAATAKALRSLGGGSAPSAPSSGGGGGTGGSMTPQFNTVGNNGINQLAQLQQQPVQAYVVSGEVTSQQALDRNRAQNSSL